MFRRIFATLLVFAVAFAQLPVRAAGVTLLGVVTQAAHANLGSAQVSRGSTVYDGDSFSTASDGLLRVRAGSAQFYLPGQSALVLHSAPGGGAIANLTAGRIVFSSAKAAAMDIEFAQAHIHSTSDRPTVAQVSVAGPKTVDVRAQCGSVQFAYRGQAQLVPEGAAYRFVLDPSDEDMVLASTGSPFPGTKKTLPGPGGRPRMGFVYFFIGATAVVTSIAIDEALESPSKP